jgi:hypothetical protein
VIRPVARARRDERGAFIVVWALLAVALLAMVAIVVDLGQLRSTRRDNQSIADLAALAAGLNLGNGLPQQACNDVWSYLKSNATGLPTGANFPCDSVPVSGCPSLATPVASRTYTSTSSGPYTISVIFPVTDADIADAKFGGVGSNDGAACQRMKVSVTRALSTFFGGVINQRNLSTSASAVVRSNRVPGGGKPSLWLLEPANCQSLTTSGGGSIEVGTSVKPGFITVDSAGTGSGCGSTISSGGSSHIYAIPSTGDPKGAISLFALPANASCNDFPNACNQGDISSGRINPQPANRPTRATRAPVDWQFNCKNDGDGNDATSIYPDYRSSPRVQIPDCPLGRPAYMDLLRTYVGTSGAPATGNWQTWSPTRSCSPASLSVATGNWLVNCPAGFNVNNGVTVEINGNVIFDGPVNVGNGGTLKINTTNTNTTMRNQDANCAPVDTVNGIPTSCPRYNSQSAAYVYMRNGNLDVRATLQMGHTMLYQHNGFINVIAGATPIWTSPDEGGFTGLAYWNEKPSTSSTDYQLLGGGQMQLEGTFFTPEARPLRLRGGGLQNALQAQFISNSLDVGGNGVLSLDPLTNKGVPDSPPSGVLIR